MPMEILHVVVLNREHYVSEAERQQNDSTFYKAQNHNPTHEFAKKVTDAILYVKW